MKRHLYRIFAAFALSFALLSPRVAMGQGGTVFGIAVDSVRGGYLPGAIVSIRGSARSAFTDSLGRFKIDSVPAGELRLELVHPFLDTLGISVVSAPLKLAPGQNLRTVVSVPSPESIIATKCTAQDREAGPGAVIGNVFDADSDQPASGARVMLVWVDYVVAGNKLVKAPRQRVTSTGADGSFRICGLPEELAANLNVSKNKVESPELGLSLAPRLAVANVFLPSPDSARRDSTQRLPAAGTITLTGRILNSAGAPLPNARVSVDETDAVALSGENGRFTLTGLPAGTRILTVRAIGYEPVETAVPLRTRASGDLTVRMTRFAIALDTVRISALRNIAMQRIGFDERRKAGFGKFFDPEDIKRRDPLRLNNLLETLPGLTYSSGNSSGGKRVLAARRGCLVYMVDGKRWRGGDDAPDYWISSQELGAVEYYQNGFVPSEFVTLVGGEGCSVIVIWTKWYLRLKQ